MKNLFLPFALAVVAGMSMSAWAADEAKPGGALSGDQKTPAVKPDTTLLSPGSLSKDAATAPAGVIGSSPDKAPASGTAGQSIKAEPNSASPTGATRNMAPTRGESPAGATDPKNSASGLTAPGASSGSSLGSGSNSTVSTPSDATSSSNAAARDATRSAGPSEPATPAIPAPAK